MDPHQARSIPHNPYVTPSFMSPMFPTQRNNMGMNTDGYTEHGYTSPYTNISNMVQSWNTSHASSPSAGSPPTDQRYVVPSNNSSNMAGVHHQPLAKQDPEGYLREISASQQNAVSKCRALEENNKSLLEVCESQKACIIAQRAQIADLQQGNGLLSKQANDLQGVYNKAKQESAYYRKIAYNLWMSQRQTLAQQRTPHHAVNGPPNLQNDSSLLPQHSIAQAALNLVSTTYSPGHATASTSNVFMTCQQNINPKSLPSPPESNYASPKSTVVATNPEPSFLMPTDSNNHTEIRKASNDLSAGMLPNANSAVETTPSTDIPASAPVEPPRQEPLKSDTNKKRKTRDAWDAGLRFEASQRNWEISGKQQAEAEEQKKAEEALLNMPQRVKKLKTTQPLQTTSISLEKMIKQRVRKAKAPRQSKASNIQSKGGVQVPDRLGLPKGTESQHRERSRERAVMDEESLEPVAEVEANVTTHAPKESDTVEDDEDERLAAEIVAFLENDARRLSGGVNDSRDDAYGEGFEKDLNAHKAAANDKIERPESPADEIPDDSLDSLFNGPIEDDESALGVRDMLSEFNK